jgi:hypothetical protein
MPVTVRTLVTSEPDTSAAVADLTRQLREWGQAPDFAFVFYGGGYDDTALYQGLRDSVPGAALIGGSSGMGVMSDAGVAANRSIGLLAIADPDGSYGVASAQLGPDPASTAEYTLHAALRAADAEGELPELVWIYQAPGHEEAVLAGLRRVVGDRCPIVGGSAASVAGGGDLRQFGANGPLSDGLVVGALFPSGGAAVSYGGGFEPTGASGIVTALADDATTVSRADGVRAGRHILTIDDRPAATVYNDWTDGALPPVAMADGGLVAAESAWWPLGMATGSANDLTLYRPVHVNAVSPQHGLRTYAEVEEGSRVHAMRGTRPNLIQRAGRIAGAALSELEDEGRRPAGALMVYCVGCRMAVGDDVDRVAACARDGFGPAGFLGCFTAGEVGPAMGVNVHANLMISAIVFGR